MINDKQHSLARLRDVFNAWEALLAPLDETQITARWLPGDMSIKDVIAHLHAWQQVSIARLEAVLHDREPQFPPAPAQFDLATENDVDGINAWFYQTYRDQTWQSVYQDWRNGFLRYLELAEAIPETDLLDTERFPWMRGYAPIAGLHGSYEHHQEHLDDLTNRLRDQGTM